MVRDVDNAKTPYLRAPTPTPDVYSCTETAHGMQDGAAVSTIEGAMKTAFRSSLQAAVCALPGVIPSYAFQRRAHSMQSTERPNSRVQTRKNRSNESRQTGHAWALPGELVSSALVQTDELVLSSERPRDWVKSRRRAARRNFESSQNFPYSCGTVQNVVVLIFRHCVQKGNGLRTCPRTQVRARSDEWP